MSSISPVIPLPPLNPPLPAPPEPSVRRDPPPDEAQCAKWWDRFDMPPHIRRHCSKVALIAGEAARLAKEHGLDVSVETVRASALLHDLAKIYCVRNGGSHSQLGAAWVMALTGDPLIAQGVFHHVYWPFELDVRRYFTPLAVLYGDKRVEHDQIVPLSSRFVDLLTRYGKTEEIRRRIAKTNRQAQAIEDALSQLLEIDLNACTFDRGRLVD